MAENSGAEQITWNLSDLYSGTDDPLLKTEQEALISSAEVLAREYRGKVAQLSAVQLKQALQQLENIYDGVGKLGSFAYLHWSTDTSDSERGKLLQSIQEFSSTLSQKLVFFEVEWLEGDENWAQALIGDPLLSPYRHYLEASRRYKAHTLSEQQEQIMSAKSVTGRSAWVRFFDEMLGNQRWTFRGETLTEQEMLTKLHEPDRQTRKEAAEAFTAGLQELSKPLTFVFNTLLSDKATDDGLRKYPGWLSSRNLSNEISDETVSSLVMSVKEFYPQVQRYYRLKTRLLGYAQMFDYDRYAPLLNTKTTIQWERAREMVVDSYQEFHPDMGSIADTFFEKQWIDAAVRPGKRSGAYSASTVPSVHPYVFMNYTGKLRDVQTLAHELGHGVHQFLSRKQGVFQADTPLTTAETASVFGEMLVFQNMLKTIADPKERLALLLEKIDDTIATVFRQISMNQFEHAMHTQRREQGELTSDAFSELWLSTQKELYGDAVTLTENYGKWWMYIPHFLHTPGYVYAYAFGELLVLALYKKYTESPDGFADRYMDLLGAGGSEWPDKLVARIGVDISDPGFWKQGLNLFVTMVEQAEEQATLAGFSQ